MHSLQYDVAMPMDVLITEQDIPHLQVSDAEGRVYVHTPVTPLGPAPGTPDHRLYSPQLEDYLSRPCSRDEAQPVVEDQTDAGTLSSTSTARTNRTQISVEQVKFRQDHLEHTVYIRPPSKPVERFHVAKEEKASPNNRSEKLSTINQPIEVAAAPHPGPPVAPVVPQRASVPQQPKAGIKYVSKTSVLRHE